MLRRASFLIWMSVLAASTHPQLGTGSADAHEMKPGLYEISVSVELPNLTSPSFQKTVTRCITQTQIEEHDTFKIMSETPLTKCPRMPVCFGKARAGFQVNCPGKRAAHAIAKFKIDKHTFRGSIRMNMGGKNMTVIERQNGQRLGPCS